MFDIVIVDYDQQKYAQQLKQEMSILNPVLNGRLRFAGDGPVDLTQISDIILILNGNDCAPETVDLLINAVICKCQIIPVMIDGCDFPDALKKSVPEVPLFHAFTLTEKHFTNCAESICKAVNDVNKRHIGSASARWLQRATASGQRFHDIEIDSRILPHAKCINKTPSKDTYDLGKLADEPLYENLYMTGDGGIGKTTVLFNIMRKSFPGYSYDAGRQIPIYLDLGQCPERSDPFLSSDPSFYIFSRIIMQLTACRENEITDQQLHDLKDEFRKEPEGAPDYLILLDGLNEVPASLYLRDTGPVSIMNCIIAEIEELLDHCPNVRIILTSRVSNNQLISHEQDLQILSMVGLTNKTISQYLAGILNEDGTRLFSEQDLHALFADSINAKLLESLRIPLFLTMYGSLEYTKDISSKAEIIRAFFSGSSRSSYSQNLVALRTASDRSINADMLIYLVDRILPWIGYHMEHANKHYIHMDELYSLVGTIFHGDRKQKVPAVSSLNAKKIHKQFLRIGDPNDITEEVVYALVHQVSVMVQSEDSAVRRFAFTHHYLRDYFSACYHVHILYHALDTYNRRKWPFPSADPALKALELYSSQCLTEELCIWIGEYLGEHKNRPHLNDSNRWEYSVPSELCDRSLLDHILSVYRNRFDLSQDYGVYNTISVLSKTRKNLAGLDLSYLDLTKCKLYDIQLGCVGLCADISGARINGTNIFPNRHGTSWIRSDINAAEFHPVSSRKECMTAACDGVIRIWDCNTGLLLKSFSASRDEIVEAHYSSDGSHILAVYTTSVGEAELVVWHTDTGRCLFRKNLVPESESRVIHQTAAFSKDGTRIITTNGTNVFQILDAKTGELLLEADGNCEKGNYASYDYVKEAVFVHDSGTGKDLVAAVCDRSCVRIWDIERMEVRCTIRTLGNIFHICASSHGDRIACSFDKKAIVYDIFTGRILAELEGHNSWVNRVAFSRDGKRIVTSGKDGRAIVWDSATGKMITSFCGHSSEQKVFSQSVTYASFSPDGSMVISGGSDNAVRIWDSSFGDVRLSILPDQSGYSAFSIGNREKIIALASTDHSVKLYHNDFIMYTGLIGHRSAINCITFSFDDRLLLTTADDMTAKLWDTDSGELLCTFIGHTAPVKGGAFLDDKTIVTGSSDGCIFTWDIRHPDAPKDRFAAQLRYLSHFTGIPNSHRIAVAGSPVLANSKAALMKEDIIQIIDTENWSSVFADSQGHKASITNLAASSDGSHIVSSSIDNSSMIWDTQTGAKICVLHQHLGHASAARFSRQGRYVVTSYSGSMLPFTNRGGCVLIWNLASNSVIMEKRLRKMHISDAVLFGNNNTLLAVLTGHSLHILAAESGDTISKIYDCSGLFLCGVDFTKLNSASDISKREMDDLYQCGAVVPDKDLMDWASSDRIQNAVHENSRFAEASGSFSMENIMLCMQKRQRIAKELLDLIKRPEPDVSMIDKDALLMPCPRCHGPVDGLKSVFGDYCCPHCGHEFTGSWTRLE